MGVFIMLENAPVEVTSTLNEKVAPYAVMGTVVDASSLDPCLSPFLPDRALRYLSLASFSCCCCFKTLVRLVAVIEDFLDM